MGLVIVTNGRYSIDDPLYQWDLNKVLEIRGLSLASIPEIHFTNSAMDRAIVRQARMDAAGVITVDVPNSLLQKPYKIKVYICIYRGASFETLYTLEIPVVARPQPSDYTISDNDGEIYSFNALENAVNNALAEIEDIDGKATAAVTKINVAEAEAIKEINDVAEEIIEKMGGEDVATKADFEALSESVSTLSEDVADLKTTKADSEHSHVTTDINGLVDLIYPVGSIYMSVNSTSPGTLFSGTTWEQIQDQFLLGASSTYPAGSTGGEATHTLTEDEMPRHNHTLQIASTESGTLTAQNMARFNSDKTKYVGRSGVDQMSLAGDGQPHNNMPPYLSVYIWKRIV